MNPFLTLDALRSKRDEEMRGRHESRLKEFGALPLNLYDLYKEYKDRESQAQQISHKQQMDKEGLEMQGRVASRQEKWLEAQTQNMNEDNRRQNAAEERAKAQFEDLQRLRETTDQRTAAGSAAMPYVAGAVPRREISAEQFDERALTKDFAQEQFVARSREQNLFPELNDDELRGLYQQAKLKRGDIEDKKRLEQDRLNSLNERFKMQLSARRAAAANAASKVKDKDLAVWAQKELTDADVRVQEITDAIETKRQSGVEMGPVLAIKLAVTDALRITDPDEGVARSKRLSIFNQLLKDRSGATVTPQEAERLDRELGRISDPNALSDALMEMLKEKTLRRYDIIVEQQSKAPGKAWVKDAYGRPDAAKGIGGAPPTGAPSKPSAATEADTDEWLKNFLK